MYKNLLIRIYFCLGICFALFSCATKGPQTVGLDPSSQKFLDIIGYIILPIEEKIFREMPFEDRGEFLQDFWARRDPDPTTPLNEFRQTYYQRVAFADMSFREGRPGWKTDRGRAYILLGPPTNILTKTMGDTPYEQGKFGTANLLETGTLTERPTIIWVYDNYMEYFAGPLRLVFVDFNSTGEFKLTTQEKITAFNMTSPTMDNLNFAKYQWVGEIELDEKSRVELGIFDYYASVEIERGNYNSALFAVDIPCRKLDYKKVSEVTPLYLCDLLISAEIRDTDNNLITRLEEPYVEKLREDRIKALMAEDIQIHREWMLDLPPGAKYLYVEITDNIKGKRLRKLLEIKSKHKDDPPRHSIDP